MNAEILIVDDNTDIRNIINELIIDAGYKTRIAANYNQALSEIDKMPSILLKPEESSIDFMEQDIKNVYEARRMRAIEMNGPEGQLYNLYHFNPMGALKEALNALKEPCNSEMLRGLKTLSSSRACSSRLGILWNRGRLP